MSICVPLASQPRAPQRHPWRQLVWMTLLLLCLGGGAVAQSTFVGTYTGTFTAASGLATRRLEIRSDNTAVLTTTYPGQVQPVVQTGTWRVVSRGGLINPTQNLIVTLNTRNGSPMTPDQITFVMRSGELRATEYNTSIYGSAGITLQPYVPFVNTYTGIVVGDNGRRTTYTLEVRQDRTAVLTLLPEGATRATVRTGTWDTRTRQGVQQLVVALTQENGRRINRDQIIFEQRGDLLVAVDYNQNRYGRAGIVLGMGTTTPPSTAFTGFYSRTYTTSSGLMEAMLIVRPDGSVTQLTTGPNQSRSITQTGTWTTANRQGQPALYVTLTRREGQTMTPDRIVFVQRENQLVAVEYNQNIYGRSGITFSRMQAYA